MRKITLFLTLLLTFAGTAWAQPWTQVVSTDDNVYEYYIQNVSNPDYYVTTTTGLTGGAQQLGSANSFSDTKAKVTFKLMADGKLYATNVATSSDAAATPLVVGYVGGTGEGSSKVQLFAEDNNYTWSIQAAADGVTICAGTSDNSWNMHGGKGNNIGLYRKTDPNSNWMFVPANEAAIAAANEEAQQAQKEAYLSSIFSEDYYYQFQNVGYSKMMASNFTKATVAGTSNTEDYYQLWKLESVPDADFKFYLKNAASGKYLKHSENYNVAWTMCEGTDEAGIFTFKWMKDAEGENPATFAIMYDEADNYSSAHIEGSETNIVRWTWENETKSQWYVRKTSIEVDLTGAIELRALITYVEALDYTAGESVGHYTQASISALNSAIAAAKGALEGEVTQEISDQHQAAINNAVASLELVKPTPGRYYVLRCAYENRCVYVNANNQLNYIANAEDYKTNSKYVWQFEDAGNGKFKMKSVETQSYVNTIATNQHITLSAEAGEVAINKGAAAGTVTFETNNAGIGIHANANPLVGWTNSAESNHYYVEEVTTFSHDLSITSAGWASLILGYNAEIPEGVQAYYVLEDPEGGRVQLTAVEGNVIPASNAVLVSGAVNTYSFKLATETATDLENNKLKGTLINKNITGDAYVLGVIDGETGLYKAELNQDNGSAFLNNAFKAYLPIAENAPETSETLSFSFGETTGISSAIIGENGKAEIFDLSGRRVAKMQKGIYIVNGKKVLVK